jgi:soluble lytic murein transglycosylase-like protein
VVAIVTTPCLLAGFVFSGLLWQLLPADTQGDSAPSSYTESGYKPFVRKVARPKKIAEAPAIIGEKDLALYREIAALERAGQWRKADALMAKVRRPLLIGHFLAERYLSPHYVTSAKELRRWLKKYADHPQAGRIERLAMKKQAIDEKTLNRPITNIRYAGDSQRNQRFRSDSWQRGIAAFGKGKYKQAYSFFSGLAEYENIHGWKDWDKAAVHFWAYRSAHKAGMKGRAHKHLTLAASAPRSFYGILAHQKLNRDLQLARYAEPLSEKQQDSLYQMAAVRRMVALSRLEKYDAISAEIHHLFPELSPTRQRQLLSLALPLTDPATQIRMGLALQRHDELPYDYAIYPRPDWEPLGGYQLEEELLLAVARQESGFDPAARSYAGAKGIMQLMPATARYMADRLAEPSAAAHLDLADPIANLTLGQRYLKYLMQKDHIGGNLIYVTAAYNAGPNNLARWQKNLRHVKDPLLFIEKIPSLETRNYVQNVMRNYWIYRTLSDDENPVIETAQALIAGKWPRYQTGEQQIAQAH